MTRRLRSTYGADIEFTNLYHEADYTAILEDAEGASLRDLQGWKESKLTRGLTKRSKRFSMATCDYLRADPRPELQHLELT